MIAADVRKRLEGAGFVAQTTRLALRGVNAGTKLSKHACDWEKNSRENGIDYVSLGPVAPPLLDELPDALAATESVFASAQIAPLNGPVDFQIIPKVAAVVTALARKTANGFGNLRFAALANCSAGIPFFPAAYSTANETSFALANETASLAVEAANASENPDDAAQRLTSAIETTDLRIRAALDGMSAFAGCDWSLAPHPDQRCSVGAAIEKLSGARIGQWGTLSAVRTLTKAIRAAQVKHVGFSGVFLPLLEDAVLAKRCTEGLDLQRLLMYSAVCGAGLDTIPLAGNVTEDSIAALMADVATLAVTLNKPLTVRLMPVPGLKAGEQTRFDSPYLINAKALSLTGAAPGLFR